MQRLLFIFLILCSSTLYANVNEEFKAVWVITWNHSSSSDDVETSKARIRTILDNVKKANMNAVLWQVRQGGVAYYNSSYEPWGPYSNGPYPDNYDVFEYAVQEAHSRGLEIHAWFNVFAASHTDPGTPAGDHPEWICRDQSGSAMTSSIALSPGLEAVREYTKNVAMEVVRNYDIDGFHMDYIRWNEYYSSALSQKVDTRTDQEQLLDQVPPPAEIERINQNQGTRYLYDVNHTYSAGVPSGYGSWEEWWRASVTEFVKTLHDSIQAEKPWVRLSPAALGRYRWGPWQGYGSVYQDAALWFNEGYIEQLTPMHYHWTTADGFYDMLTGSGTDNWGAWIQDGIGAGRLYSVGPGSYVLADNYNWNNHESIVNKCRTILWVDGFQFFSYGDWQEYRYWETAAERFFTRKTKIRSLNMVIDDLPIVVPDSPTIATVSQDSFHYEITVTPPATIEANQWFVLYRSEDDSIDVAQDEILEIHFGQTAYTVADTFNGNQDFNGQYTYFATMLDRYWTESPASNTFLTDSIPSFAPQVIETYPLSGDSLNVKENIRIYFSKTMETASFPGRVGIDSGAEIEELNWSDKEKSLTVSVVGNWNYNTGYTLSISDSATDVNGRMLDGNGDGGSSEPFVFYFHTIGEDQSGPRIVYSNLQAPDSTFNVDTKNILTIAFDELIDETTINEDNLILMRGSRATESKYKIFTINDQSVVSVQGNEPFGSYVNYSLELSSSITDTAGNAFGSDVSMPFRTEAYAYDAEKIIDELYPGSGDWWDPEGSGSTTGTIGSNTTFAYVNSNYLPANPTPFKRYSARLRYEWDPEASSYLIREYCKGGDPKLVKFDTSYTVQCYVYGDASGNQFRFSLSENKGGGYPLEVSTWYTVDWLGWRLVEWHLNDPNSVGSWLGDEVLNGTDYKIDSFQLTHPDGSAVKGAIYFTNLRAVKKVPNVTALQERIEVPHTFSLSQNYPNPFNPLTTIRFSVDRAGMTQIVVYNMLGQKVAQPLNTHMPAGAYQLQFDGRQLASGTYIYELRNNHQVLRKKMVLLK